MTVVVENGRRRNDGERDGVSWAARRTSAAARARQRESGDKRNSAADKRDGGERDGGERGGATDERGGESGADDGDDGECDGGERDGATNERGGDGATAMSGAPDERGGDRNMVAQTWWRDSGVSWLALR